MWLNCCLTPSKLLTLIPGKSRRTLKLLCRGAGVTWELHSNEMPSFALDVNAHAAAGRYMLGLGISLRWLFEASWLVWKPDYFGTNKQGLHFGTAMFFWFYFAAFQDVWKSMSKRAKLRQKLALCLCSDSFRFVFISMYKQVAICTAEYMIWH